VSLLVLPPQLSIHGGEKEVLAQHRGVPAHELAQFVLQFLLSLLDLY
jgi:hypothetical protein